MLVLILVVSMMVYSINLYFHQTEPNTITPLTLYSNRLYYPSIYIMYDISLSTSGGRIPVMNRAVQVEQKATRSGPSHNLLWLG